MKLPEIWKDLIVDLAEWVFWTVILFVAMFFIWSLCVWHWAPFSPLFVICPAVAVVCAKYHLIIILISL
jgi:hypothetical protein